MPGTMHIDHSLEAGNYSVNTGSKAGKVLVSHRIPKGWGWEDVIINREEFCGKILHIKPGLRFSDHYHVKKLEYFYILRGTVSCWLRHPDGTEQEVHLGPGDILEITPGLMHQLMCTSKESADILEISTNDNFEDSYRIQKGD